MGNYLFDTELLLRAVEEDATNVQSTHDFGRDILPRLVREEGRIYAYDFRTNWIPTSLKGEEQGYWRDVGTIEAYYEANMDLRAVNPTSTKMWSFHRGQRSAITPKRTGSATS